MKKLFYSLFALCSLTLSAQEKTYSFDKKVSYNIKIPNEYLLIDTKDLNMNLYISKDAILGNSDGNYYFDGFTTNAFLATNNKFFDVTVNSLENNLQIKTPTYYDGVYDDYYQPYSDNFFGKIGKITHLNTTETFNGFTCHNYQVEITENDSTKVNTFCIDHTSKINNAKLMLPNQNINGLIVKYIDSDANGLYIKKIADSNIKVTFDEAKSIEKYNQVLADNKKEYENYLSSADSIVNPTDDYVFDNSYYDPINLYSNYATSESENVNNVFNTIASFTYYVVQQDANYDGDKDFDRSKAIKTSEESTKQIVRQFKKNGLINKSEAKELNNLFNEYFNDAKNFKFEQVSQLATDSFDETDTSVANVATDFSSYSSEYKKLDLNDISLAIDQPEIEIFLQSAPKHCKDLKNNIPSFSDNKLFNLVYNYTGQVCDLYIYNSGYVALESTIDAIRKSVLELNNSYESMTKEDKEKLKRFLNSLD